MNETTNTTTTEAALKEMQTLMYAMFAAQDIWEDAGSAIGTPEHEAYKAAAVAHSVAQSAWINS